MQKIRFFLISSLFLFTFGAFADDAQKDANKKEKPAQVSAGETMVRAWCDDAINDFDSCKNLTPPINCKTDEYKALNNKLQQCLGAMIQKEEQQK